MERIFALLLLILLPAGQANSLSCAPPYWPYDPNLSDEENKKNDIDLWASLLRLNAPEEVVVFGKFSKLKEGPFVHKLEREFLLKNRDKIDGYDQAIRGDLEYKYRGVLRFDGLQILSDQVLSLQTEDTVLIIPFIEGFYGTLPLSDQLMVGKMSKDQFGSYVIFAGLCGSFWEISQKDFKRLATCLIDETC